MGRKLALGSEVFGGLDKAGAEEPFPKRLTSDTRGERVVPLDQPTARNRRRFGRHVFGGRLRKTAGTPAETCIAQVEEAASNLDVGLALVLLRQFAQDREWWGRRRRLVAVLLPGRQKRFPTAVFRLDREIKTLQRGRFGGARSTAALCRAPQPVRARFQSGYRRRTEAACCDCAKPSEAVRSCRP